MAHKTLCGLIIMDTLLTSLCTLENITLHDLMQWGHSSTRTAWALVITYVVIAITQAGHCSDTSVTLALERVAPTMTDTDSRRKSSHQEVPGSLCTLDQTQQASFCEMNWYEGGLCLFHHSYHMLWGNCWEEGKLVMVDMRGSPFPGN